MTAVSQLGFSAQGFNTSVGCEGDGVGDGELVYGEYGGDGGDGGVESEDCCFEDF